MVIVHDSGRDVLTMMNLRNFILSVLVYFGIVFGAGFALGIIRTLVVVPVMGERIAELVEIPFMLVVVFYAARFVVRQFRQSVRAHLASGMLALLVLLGFEFTVVLGLRGMSIAEYLASRDPVSFSAYAGSLMLFAIMPASLRALTGRSK